MDDAIIQAYARLTVHEFALEVMMANWLAGLPEEQADSFLDDFCDRSRSPWLAGDPAVQGDVATQIVQDSITLTDHFAEKVRSRSREIRAKATQR